jgi:glycosyltransferase involved in cell wall biosynthesis
MLELALDAFLSHVSYPRERLELIVSDDGSPKEVQAAIRDLSFDRFVLSERNTGLGANTNRGLLAATGDFILQIQDDCLCVGPADLIHAALDLFQTRADVELVRYQPPSPEGALGEISQTSGGRRFQLYSSGMFSSVGQFAYSDQPHIKRRSFHERFGLYRERVPMTVMEVDFAKRIDTCESPCIATLAGYDQSFTHIGESRSFNPGVSRGKLRQALLDNVLTRYPFIIYLTMKHARSVAQILPTMRRIRQDAIARK